MDRARGLHAGSAQLAYAKNLYYLKMLGEVLQAYANPSF